MLSIQPGGQYQLTDGTLVVNGGLLNQGILSGGAGAGAISVASSSLVDLSAGTLQNSGSTALNIGGNSLLIVAPGFNPAVFGSYTNNGMVHTAGTPLTISAGKNIAGAGAINDFVNDQGTVSAGAGNNLNLNNGLSLSGTGYAYLGTGSLTVNDTLSGINNGTLSAANEYLGTTGNAAFSQTGGYNFVGQMFGPPYLGGVYLGYAPSCSASYVLSGSGQLYLAPQSSYVLSVGYSGTGNFYQSGGCAGGDPNSSGAGPSPWDATRLPWELIPSPDQA